MNQVCETALTQTLNLKTQILRIQNIVTLLVNDFALVVGNIIVFQQLLANIEVTGFHFALRTLNAARHHASLNRFTLRHLQSVHDGFDPLTGKYAHQRIV